MPFTFCHPAITLPLTKSKKLSTSALIIGSTAPDFEYFLRMDMIRTHSHDFWAIFYFNLPLTIVLYLIFQLVVKTPLINNLPKFFHSRFQKYSISNPNIFLTKNILVIVISATIGIYSHLFWDSFTHKEGLFEGQLPYLLETITINGKDILVFQFLQIWSSIIGGLYILYFIYKMPSNQVKLTGNVFKFWSIAITISFTVIFLRQCQNSSQFIATSIASGFIGLILTSLLFRKTLNNSAYY